MKKILVADDDEMICQLYSEELSIDGYEVISTSEGGRLIETVEKHEPDLIVLDVKMGQYDGLDLLKEIRNLYYNMPVILCSAYSSFKYDLRAIAADYYVVKSADLTELKVTTTMALEGNLTLLTEELLKKGPRQEKQRVRQIVGG